MEELEHTNYARYLVKGTTIVFSELVVAGLIGLLLRMYLARGLSVEEYGLFYAALAFVSFFATFRDLGLSSALVKYIPEFEVRKRFGEIKSSIAFTLLFQAVFALPISVALFVFSDQIALVIFKTIQASLVIKILGIWFFTAIFLPLFQAVFQGFQNMLAYASMDFFNILFAFLSAMLLVGLLGLGVGGAALGYLLASLVVGVLGFILFRRRYSHVVAEKIQIKKPLIKRLFVFGLPAFIGGLGGLILSYQDTIMITLFRTLPEVGFYQVAQPTTRILGMFVGALTAVLFPMVSELWTRRKRRLLGRALHFLIKFSFILIVPVALVFMAFPDIVVRLLFGEHYLAAVTALQILACNAIAGMTLAILASMIAGIGKPIVNTKVIGAMAGLNFFGNLILIPPYGIEGAAMATLLSTLLGVFISFYYAKKFVEFTLPTSPIFKTLIGAALTLLLISGLKSAISLPPWPEAFVVTILGLLFYGGWVFATGAITRGDVRLVTSIIPMPTWLANFVERFARS